MQSLKLHVQIYVHVFLHEHLFSGPFANWALSCFQALNFSALTEEEIEREEEQCMQRSAETFSLKQKKRCDLYLAFK